MTKHTDHHDIQHDDSHGTSNPAECVVCRDGIDAAIRDNRDLIGQGMWGVTGVLGGEEPEFTYTSGLHVLLDAPEIVLSGLPIRLGQALLNGIGKRIEELRMVGGTFDPSLDMHDIIEQYPIKFRVLGPYREVGITRMAAAAQLTEDFTVVQALWPDKNGHFPGDPDCDPKIAEAQDVCAFAGA